MQPPRGTADIEKHPFLVPMVLRPVRGTDFVSSSRIKSITARLPALKNAVEYIVKDLIYSQGVKHVLCFLRIGIGYRTMAYGMLKPIDFANLVTIHCCSARRACRTTDTETMRTSSTNPFSPRLLLQQRMDAAAKRHCGH